MKYVIEVPEYNNGIQYHWIGDSRISVTSFDGSVIIKANRDGLMSLANHLVNLAQEKMPKHSHMHFDELNGGVETGSMELIIEKE